MYKACNLASIEGRTIQSSISLETFNINKLLRKFRLLEKVDVEVKIEHLSNPRWRRKNIIIIQRILILDWLETPLSI
jgi:hypothetical protein